MECGIQQGDPLSPFLFLIAAEGLNLLAKRAVRDGLLRAALVGKEKVVVSHIQYADDTVFVVEGCLENAQALKWILENFEMLSGLSVNFEKSCAYGVNIVPDKMKEIASVLGCRAGEGAIPYLGLRVGNRVNGVESWNQVIEKMRKKLQGWVVKSISIGGRATLVQSSLSAVPLYWLSFLPLPKAVEDKLRSLQSNFFWGGDSENRRIAWLRWEEISRPKKEGGLGFKNLRHFNKALLCKWIWRFITEKDSLWGRIIRSRHGVPSWIFGRPDGRVRGSGSGWWRKITSIVEGADGGWFFDSLRQKLGDGKVAPFWDGRWSGEMAIKDIHPRLFHLSTRKEEKVFEMGKWVEGKWVWNTEWRRALLERERGKEAELLDFLGRFSITEGVTDTWTWGATSDGTFSVKDAYKILNANFASSREHRPAPLSLSVTWKATATMKAKIMAWRLLWDCLPTKDNVNKIMELAEEEKICAICKSARESALHTFLECGEICQIWGMLVEWIGVVWVPPNSIEAHLLSFAGLLRGKECRRRLGGLWICAVWVVWKWRNGVVFGGKLWEPKRIVEEIKCRFWSWCVTRGSAEEYLSFDAWANQSLAVQWNRSSS